MTDYHKEIRYDRETRDYAYYLNDQIIGFARTYHEAEVELDTLVYDLLNGEPAALVDDMYRVLCLIVSGTSKTLAISEVRRVIARYEAETNH